MSGELHPLLKGPRVTSRPVVVTVVYAPIPGARERLAAVLLDLLDARGRSGRR